MMYVTTSGSSKTRGAGLGPLRGSLVLMSVMWLSGCVVGYRYHGLDEEAVSPAGDIAQVRGQGHMVYLGLVLDFRYLRVGTPAMGARYELEAQSEGGFWREDYSAELRGFQLDLPVLSLWSEDEGVGYPGRLVHRRSVDIWLGGALMPGERPHWWADASVVYYDHDLWAARLFAGYGEAPVDATLRGWSEGNTTFEYYETMVGGPTAGIELTVLAGEQALDFLTWFGEAQDAAVEEASGRR